MKYQEIYDEYVDLLRRHSQIRFEIDTLPGETKDQTQFADKENPMAELALINIEMDRIEKSVKRLDENLSRTFLYLRQCADMDAMPIARRADALSFANSMTALEGLPTRNETEQSLIAWSRGEKSFADFYIPTLRFYHVIEGG